MNAEDLMYQRYINAFKNGGELGYVSLRDAIAGCAAVLFYARCNHLLSQGDADRVAKEVYMLADSILKERDADQA